MSLKLMYITNSPDIASIAQSAGVDRIFVDLEFIGKEDRQRGMNTVKNHHTVEDVKRLRSIVTDAELMVRVNPIHSEKDDRLSSEEEIEKVIEYGADLVMLPFFRTVDEVRRFLKIVNGRAKAMLLVETPEAVSCMEEILQLDGIDEVHIGLNDLSIGYQKSFMFQLLTDGTVEKLCTLCAAHGIPFGIGGIASLGNGELRSDYIIMEHYRLGSVMAILSRSFCNTERMTDLNEIAAVFTEGIRRIRAYEAYCVAHPDEWPANRQLLTQTVDNIVERMKQ